MIALQYKFTTFNLMIEKSQSSCFKLNNFFANCSNINQIQYKPMTLKNYIIYIYIKFFFLF